MIKNTITNLYYRIVYVQNRNLALRHNIISNNYFNFIDLIQISNLNVRETLITFSRVTLTIFFRLNLSITSIHRIFLGFIHKSWNIDQWLYLLCVLGDFPYIQVRLKLAAFEKKSF